MLTQEEFSSPDEDIKFKYHNGDTVLFKLEEEITEGFIHDDGTYLFCADILTAYYTVRDYCGNLSLITEEDIIKRNKMILLEIISEVKEED